MSASHAVIVGAGIGGLTSALALHRRGWQVTVCERAPALDTTGVGIMLWPNGLRGLDTVGVGDKVRWMAMPQRGFAVRRPDGGGLLELDPLAFPARFGEPLVALPRTDLVEALAGRLPANCLHLGTAATGLDPGTTTRPARLSTNRGELAADLLVAADGTHSVLRAAAFPHHGGMRYRGQACWRLTVRSPVEIDQPGETWGCGAVFGVVPLTDNRAYCYATVAAPAPHRHPDELAELLGRFGRWHAPIPELITASTRVAHHDVEDLTAQPPSFHRGRLVLVGDCAHAMSPHLGLGGALAIEDAVVLAHLVGLGAPVTVALARYTADRRQRAAALARRAHLVGRLRTLSNRQAVVARDLGARLAGHLPSSVMTRALSWMVDWHPPGRA